MIPGYPGCWFIIELRKLRNEGWEGRWPWYPIGRVAPVSPSCASSGPLYTSSWISMNWALKMFIKFIMFIKNTFFALDVRWSIKQANLTEAATCLLHYHTKLPSYIYSASTLNMFNAVCAWVEQHYTARSSSNIVTVKVLHVPVLYSVLAKVMNRSRVYEGHVGCTWQLRWWMAHIDYIHVQ